MKISVESTSLLKVRTMNQELIIALLCGDQRHCQKIGHGKQGKVE